MVADLFETGGWRAIELGANVPSAGLGSSSSSTMPISWPSPFKEIQFVLPVDFVLQDGRVADSVGKGEQQFDVGPKTSEMFERKVGEFIEASQAAIAAGRRTVVFHNGVFGMFEDPRFEQGTRRFVVQLKRMKDAGIEVYVGGGEGGKALKNTVSPIGSPIPSPPAGRCSTRSAVRQCLISRRWRWRPHHNPNPAPCSLNLFVVLLFIALLVRVRE